MSLTRPVALYLLLFLLPLALAERWRIARIAPTVRAVWGGEAALSWKRRRIRAALLRAVSWIALSLACAGPVSGLRPSRGFSSGQDVAFLLDVSRSMGVTEGGMTRLARARSAARAIMDGIPEARFALCVFKGKAMTVFPMTDDCGSIDEFLDTAGSHLLTEKGTDIEAGLDEALGAFNAHSAAARAIVLFSDGEGLRGRPERAAERARAAGVPIHAIGIGSEEGGPVPETPSTKSKRDREALLRICRASGGSYADEENRTALRAILETLRGSLSPGSGGSARPAQADASAPFILLGCLSLALSALAGIYPGTASSGGSEGRMEGKRVRGAAGALLIVFGSLCGCDRLGAALSTADAVMAAARDDHPKAIEGFLAVLPRVSGTDADAVRYDLALSYSAMGEGEAAIDLALRAADSGSQAIAARSWYALGCFHFMDADYRKAWEAFRECLRLEPGSHDAKVNLELSWERMEREGGAAPIEAAAAGRGQAKEGEREEFELIRQAERDRYRNAAERGAEGDAGDY